MSPKPKRIKQRKARSAGVAHRRNSTITKIPETVISPSSYKPIMKKTRKRYNSMAKPNVLNRRKFEFIVFTSIKDILEYLGIANCMHLFVDNKLSAVIDFYKIDEFKLKRMLMPVAVRNLILRYTQFYNKEVRRRM